MKRIFNQTIARRRVGTLFAPLALCAALLLDLPCPARAAAPETSSSAVSNAHTGPRSTDISAFNL
ncbi:MAG TPA: hypothetical protein VHH88_04390, partial [Verrucomicrobiae bacterium]|nr:hypothetical protein [Verrucomicrobiae bacterium]